ncbi:putative replication factor C small subunit [Acanthamoeba polyphaga moumouvirus]|uniref:Putative replication factor C small subunit n=2 Tax=Moumouvirus TaxID=3080801 RepID=L7RBJ3_9VIRU|nr:putative replication factor C small subunit [Acanthamoeba polyphaga moumouvirus]AEX62903.1 putative replication factor C small subunit [Moumouvirus Monve]AGC01869.1 putative replication factor C small subunit [Acanthamoeba polyphaga moumouvirus]AQN68228.1 putative replication factor c small subunit [Saudi moumouvirus]
MFLFEKYRPKNFREFLFNKNTLDQLNYLASNEDIPHIIISGPPGAGKKTLVKFFLEALYDSDVNVLSKMKYNINGSSTKKEIEIFQSNYHIIIEPTSTNHDKYILQEIIKQYAMHKSFNIFKTTRKFKTIVIYNIENLANNSQAALRRTMELYAKTCRFVMVSNNLSKIFDPLRSRCRTFCVSQPSIDDIKNVVTHISLMENIKLENDDMNFILNNCDNNIKRAIWILDSKRLNSDPFISLDEVFDSVVESILKSLDPANNLIRLFDNEIRTDIYNILITNIKGSVVITTLMDKLIRKINNDEVNIKIIKAASDAEYNLIHGRRDIIHIDYFISSVIKELITHRDILKINITSNKSSNNLSPKNLKNSGSKTSKNSRSKTSKNSGSKTNKK